MHPFRKRWNLCLRKGPAKDVLLAETMQMAAPVWSAKNTKGVPCLIAFWGPPGGPHFGAVLPFSVEIGNQKKRKPSSLRFFPRGKSRVAVVPFPAEKSTTWPPNFAAEVGRDQREVLVLTPQKLRRPSGQVPRPGSAGEASRAQLRKAL